METIEMTSISVAQLIERLQITKSSFQMWNSRNKVLAGASLESEISQSELGKILLSYAGRNEAAKKWANEIGLELPQSKLPRYIEIAPPPEKEPEPTPMPKPLFVPITEKEPEVIEVAPAIAPIEKEPEPIPEPPKEVAQPETIEADRNKDFIKSFEGVSFWGQIAALFIAFAVVTVWEIFAKYEYDFAMYASKEGLRWFSAIGSSLSLTVPRLAFGVVSAFEFNKRGHKDILAWIGFFISLVLTVVESYHTSVMFSAMPNHFSFQCSIWIAFALEARLIVSCIK